MKPSVSEIKKALKGKYILLLKGGNSSESKISEITSQRVAESLIKLGLKIKVADPEKSRTTIHKLIKGAGLVFMGLHGGYGENGTVQGVLEYYKVPYTGTDVLGSAIGMNKIVTKLLCNASGIPTPEFYNYMDYENAKEFINKTESKLKYPFILKIANEGSGRGVFQIKNVNQFKKVLRGISKENLKFVYSERYIEGKEIASGVLSVNGKPKVLPILEAKYQSDFFDYDTRYAAGGHTREVPARISKKASQKINEISIKAFNIFFIKGYVRLDIRLGKNDVPYLLEITTLPGFTEKSWFPAMAQAAGYDLEKLLIAIIKDSLYK